MPSLAIPSMPGTNPSQYPPRTLGYFEGSATMRLLLPSIHSRSARTVRNHIDFTSSRRRLAMIFEQVSLGDSPVVPMWITTVLPSWPAARMRASTSTTSLPCRLSAASTVKPSASNCDLAPSITDSPIATGGRWSTGSVVVVVDEVDVVDIATV